MKGIRLSLNQLAEFSGATEKGKQRIVRQQVEPNPFLIPWYQLTKAKIKRSIELKGNPEPIYQGIEALIGRKPANKRQAIDRIVSIEALERFIKMKLPEVLSKMDYSFFKPEIKSVNITGVNVIVAPEIIIKGELNGETIIGGIKLHVSKNKPFDYTKSLYVATTIYKYLKENVAKDDEVVYPGLCLSLDIFGDRIVSAPEKPEKVLAEIEKYCEEIKKIWSDTVQYLE